MVSGRGQQICVVVVFRDELAHEGAPGDHGRVPLVHGVERAPDERRPEALAFVLLVHLGVREHIGAITAVVLTESRDLTVDDGLEAMRGLVLRDLDVHAELRSRRAQSVVSPRTSACAAGMLPSRPAW